jgi:RHH-type proline utilization regulon transcriptional repressor/proline dehydrogenase/delta 1-pyrroline-5-carboxylate dehydrogenase
MIITPSAGLDQAIADLLRSAFGHAGQKCSATSLGIVVGELYDDLAFRARLRGMRSIRVGRRRTGDDDGSLIRADAIQRRLHRSTRASRGSMGRHDSTLTRRTRLDTRRASHVAGGSWFKTECFGPVLGLMRRDLTTHRPAERRRSASPVASTRSTPPRSSAGWRRSG